MYLPKYFLVLLLFLLSGSAGSAPKSELWPEWLAHADSATLAVDHGAWQRFLDTYLRNGEDGVNRVEYAAVGEQERDALQAYLDRLRSLPVSSLTRAQQLAYWINLYNAGTVSVVLAHYPVASIRDIDISPGWFNDGPWGKKLFDIEGRQVSLDDIEHRILRPIWRDPRLHYALNCASVGCPNLQPSAFSADNAEVLLQRAARDYVNHPRGARLERGELKVSSIYRWFEEDFGGSEEAVIRHLRHYAAPPLVQELAGIRRIDGHHYDWSLNDAR